MKKIFYFVALSYCSLSWAQSELVFVYFKDKPNKTSFYSNPQTELNQKSLERREKFNINLVDEDAPIEHQYITNIENLGYEIKASSKWLNGVAIEIEPENFSTITNLQFVEKIESFVKNRNANNRVLKKNKFPEPSKKIADFNYGNSLVQIEQIKLRELHSLGYTGKGISIAIMDTEFPTVNTGVAFQRVRENNQIKGTYNFTNKTSDVYTSPNNYTHGTHCFGIIGGYIENQFVGSAPDADFYLYTTENGAVEIPHEELYWIEAAEQADRVGVDIISTSLGYRDFDDARYDYNYDDMDGETTFIARGAKIAADKGILLVISAGNEGNNSQYNKIVSPADQPNVFTIGSVNSSGNTSSFSSFGPNANQHPKPDAAAMGTNTYYPDVRNNISRGNGTSYSTPLAAGGIASLLQAIPNTHPQEIMNLLRSTSSLYPNYNRQIGYGILNFYSTLTTLKAENNMIKDDFKIYPNPVKTEFRIMGTSSSIKSIEIFDSLGRKIKEFASQESYQIPELIAGKYFIKINTDNGTSVQSVLKL